MRRVFFCNFSDYKRVLAGIVGFWLPLVIISLWLLLAIIAPLLPLAPERVVLESILLPPGQGAILGFDDLGRPLFDRLVMGARTSLIVAISVVGVSVGLGVLIGMFSAYYGGWVDRITVHFIDIFLAFPGILLAIALAGILGPGIENVIIALSAVGWVGYARLVRAQVLSIKHREHIQAAVALGSGSVTIFRRHLLPLIMAPVIVEASFGVVGIVIAEAGLSFLGLGVLPPSASWGNMIQAGARYVLVAPHMVIIPGVALMLLVLAVNMLGDRLRDHLDVRYKVIR